MNAFADEFKHALTTRFNKHYVINDETGCWEWTACKHKFGYGLITINKKSAGAHRISWELFRGPIPKGMMVLHAPVICHKPSCVNPDHLRVGTAKENVADKKLDGTHRNGPRKLTIEQQETIRASHKYADELAKEYGVSDNTIHKLRKGVERPKLARRGENPVPPHFVGAEVGTSKLTNEQVEDIRSRTGVSQTQLAKEFGVSQALISKIKLGGAWKHLPKGEHKKGARVDSHLTEENVADIRRRPDEPLSQLAKEFGVSETHICRIRLGKSRLA